MRLSQAPRRGLDRPAAIGTPRRDLDPGVFPGLRASASIHGLFALCEISKGIVIIWIGDFATADAVGDLVRALACPPLALRGALSIASKGRLPASVGF